MFNCQTMTTQYWNSAQLSSIVQLFRDDDAQCSIVQLFRDNEEWMNFERKLLTLAVQSVLQTFSIKLVTEKSFHVTHKTCYKMQLNLSKQINSIFPESCPSKSKRSPPPQLPSTTRISNPKRKTSRRKKVTPSTFQI